MALRRLSALACAYATTLVTSATAAALDVPARAVADAVHGPSVAAFYYPWYGTPARDGAWVHWRTARNEPATGYVPTRGAYSSSDPLVVAGHMAELRRAGVDTVVVSWWGRGSVEDRRLPLVVATARANGLRVALHVEPYPGRTPVSVETDLRELAPLALRDVYVYDSIAHPDGEWAAVNGRLGGVRMFAHTALAGKAKRGGFAGLYTYDVLVHDGRSFRRLCRQARAVGLLCAPSVGPGFDARNATGEPRVRDRRGGRTYDAMWRAAIRAGASIVTVTSYNEWHEGTQIEPARGGYDGAWGKVGRAAERAYLERTAHWSARFRAATPTVTVR
jgi:hypothetical protein